MIDPDFKYPSILRGNIGCDTQLPGGLYGTVDFVWSKTIKDIKYQNLNFGPALGRDRSRRTAVLRAQRVSTLSDAILLENTTKGYTWNLSLRSAAAVPNGFFASGAYCLRRGEEHHGRHVGPGGVELGQRLHSGRPEQPAAGRGRTSIRATASRCPGATSVPFCGEFKPAVSVFYSGQSGRPYTMTTSSDVNGDVRNANDLRLHPDRRRPS